MRELVKRGRHSANVRPKTAGILLILTGGISILVALTLAVILWAFSEGMAMGFGSARNAPLFFILVAGVIGAVSSANSGNWRDQRPEKDGAGSGTGRFDLRLSIF